MRIRRITPWSVGGLALLLGTTGAQPLWGQEAVPGSDALRGEAVAEAQEEEQEDEPAEVSDDDEADEEAAEEEERQERLMREVEELRAELREREEELRNSMLQRQFDRARRAEEAARRAFDEAALAERLQGVIRAGQSKYWIGVQTAKLTEEQREELNLEASVKGVVVESVVDDSPAQSAGLQNGDVITSVDGEAIEEVGQLIAAVTKAENRAMKLGVVRGMDRLTLEVTPAERPRTAVIAGGIPGFGMEMDLQGALPGGLRPGMNLEGVPAGMSIQVAREGEGPAKIKVDYQGKTYEVTSESIEELPEEIREQVRGMVDGNGITILQGFGAGDFDLRMPPGMEMRLPQLILPREEGMRLPEDDLREEVEKLRGEMNELRKVIEELRRSIM